MRRLGGAIVLLMVGVACAPVKSAQPPATDAGKELGAADQPDAARIAEAPADGAHVAEVAATETPPPESPWLAVRGVTLESAGAGKRLSIGLSRTPDGVRDFTLPSPPQRDPCRRKG